MTVSGNSLNGVVDAAKLVLQTSTAFAARLAEINATITRPVDYWPGIRRHTQAAQYTPTVAISVEAVTSQPRGTFCHLVTGMMSVELYLSPDGVGEDADDEALERAHRDYAEAMALGMTRDIVLTDPASHFRAAGVESVELQGHVFEPDTTGQISALAYWSVSQFTFKQFQQR